MLIDQLADPALQQRRNCVAGALAIVLAHSMSSACIACIIQNAAGKLLIVAVCGIGMLPHTDLTKSAAYPSSL